MRTARGRPTAGWISANFWWPEAQRHAFLSTNLGDATRVSAARRPVSRGMASAA